MIKKLFEKFIFRFQILRYKMQRFDYFTFLPIIAAAILPLTLIIIVIVLNLLQPKITLSPEEAGQLDFTAQSEPTFILNAKKILKITPTGDQGGQIFGAKTSPGEYVIGENTLKTSIYYQDQKQDFYPEISPFKGQTNQFKVRVPKPKQFTPGKYTIKIEIITYKKEYSLEQDFHWGVLALNTNQDVYQPNQKAEIAMAVLNDNGHMVCDASVSLQIINPKHEIRNLSTEDGSIKVNPDCHLLNYTKTPDFQTTYEIGGIEGEYKMILQAETKNGSHTITDKFSMEKNPQFLVKREGPTRIYPPAKYQMKIKTESAAAPDVIKEFVPKSFKIYPSDKFTIQTEGDKQIIIWHKNLSSKNSLIYEFKTPAESPQFYLLGPLKTESYHNFFQEKRAWQIAADAEVPIDTTTVSATILAHQKSGKNIVCKSADYCYAFYIDVNNDLVYKKSTDGGANWDASATVLDAGTWVASAVWYDKWTPGDSGTYIHIAYFSTADDIMYERFQTTDNTHLSTEATIASTGQQGTLQAANDVAVSKGTDGDLYAATVDATAPTAPANFTHKCPVSSDCTQSANWASAGANPWDGVGQDADGNHSLIILPLPDDASHDPGDMMLVSFDVDTAANGIEYKVYDDSADSWSANFTTILAATDSTTYTHTLSGTVNPTTGALYISWVNNAGTISTSVVNSYKYSSGSWSALTSPRTAVTNYYVTESSIGIDSSTNDLYVVYSRGTSATANDVFYSKSENDGSTWSMENLLSDGTDRNHRAISIDNYNASRLYAIWHDLTNYDLYGNSVVAPVTYITISGSCDQYDRGTDCTDAGPEVIAVAINGVLQAQTDGTVDGSWVISGITQPAANATITVFIDGEATANERATAATKYNSGGTGDIGGVTLYQRHLTIGSDQNTTVANSDMDDYDYNAGSDPDDADIIYDVDANNDLTVDNLGSYSDEMLYVLASNTYQPDSASSGNVTTHDIEIDGTLTANNNTLYIGGSWNNDATFTAGGSTINFNSGSGTETIDSTGAAVSLFNALTHTGASTLQLNSAIDVNAGGFSQTAGTFNCSGQNQNFSGAFSLSLGTVYQKGGTLTFDAAGSQTVTDSTAAPGQDLGAVTIGPSTTTSVSTANKMHVTTLITGADDTLNISDDTLTIRGTSTPFTEGGAFTVTGSTVVYAGAGTTNITTTQYNNLTVTPESGSATYSLAGHLTNGNALTGNLTINANATLDTLPVATSYNITCVNVTVAGTLDMASASSTITVSGDWVTSGTLTSGSSTVDFNKASTSQTLTSGGTGAGKLFNNLTHSGTGTLQIITNDLDIDGNFNNSNASGTFDANGKNMSVKGTYNNTGTFTAGAGIVTFDATTGTITLAGTMTGSSAFTNIVFNDAGGNATFRPTASITVTADFTLTDGILDLDTSDPTVTLGNDSGTGNVNLNGGSVTASGSANFILNDNPTEFYSVGSITLGNVVIGSSPAVTNLKSDLIAASLTIAAGDTLNTKGYETDIGTGGISVAAGAPGGTFNTTDTGGGGYEGNGTIVSDEANFAIGAGGVFTKDSDGAQVSLVQMDGGTTKTLTTTTEDLGNFQTSVASTHIDLQDTLNVDSVTIDGSTTLDSNGFDITCGGNWANSGTFTSGSQQVTFDAGATGKTIDAGGTGAGKPFNDVVFNNGSGGWTIQTNDMKVGDDLTITDVSAWALAGSKTLEVVGNYSIEPAETSATTWNADSIFYLNGTSQTISLDTYNAEDFDKLQIGNNTDIRMWYSRAVNAITPYTVSASGSLYSMDHANNNGDLYIWGDYHTQNTTTDRWSYATDFDGDAVTRQVDVRIDPSSKVTVDSGGTLNIIGEAAPNRTTVSRQAADGYELVCDGGTIDIEYSDFDYLDGPAGLDIKAASTVTALANNTFENLVGTGGTDANITVVTTVIGLGNRTFSGNSFSLGAGDKNVARTGADDTEYWDFDTTDGEADDWNNTTSLDEDDPGMLRWNDSSSGNANPDTPTNLGPAGYIDAAGWMNDNTPTFNFDITDPDVDDQVKYRIQIDDTAGFGSPVLDYQPSSFDVEGTYYYTVGQAGSYAVGSPGMTLSDSAVGGGYYWQVKAIDDDLAESAYEEAGVDSTIDFRVDATAPTGGTVKDGQLAGADLDWNSGSLNQLLGNWDGTEPSALNSGLSKYEYALRREPDDNYWSVCSGAGVWQVGANWCDNGTSTSFTQNNLNLQTGVSYYISLRTTDNAGNISTPIDSNGLGVLPTLSLTLSDPTVDFADLNNSNGWTDTENSTVTTSTNAANGYVVYGYETQPMTSLAYPAEDIDDFVASWASPKNWPAATYGFGYTSNDPLVQSSNRFGADPCPGGGTPPPCYAPFKDDIQAPGDIVADHTDAVNGQTGAVSGEVFTITYKVAVSTTQPAATYRTYVMYLVTANY